MASLHEVAPDALPYYDQGYEDSGVREMVYYITLCIVKVYIKCLSKSWLKKYKKFGWFWSYQLRQRPTLSCQNNWSLLKWA